MSGAFYSRDTPESAWSALSGSLIPAVLSAGEIRRHTFLRADARAVQAMPFAKAGIEGALWDAYAKTVGVPLWRTSRGASATHPFGRRHRHLRSGCRLA